MVFDADLMVGIDEEGDVTLDRVYSNVRTLWIEPETDLGGVVLGLGAALAVTLRKALDPSLPANALIRRRKPPIG